jgi:hypothetical protein
MHGFLSNFQRIASVLQGYFPTPRYPREPDIMPLIPKN